MIQQHCRQRFQVCRRIGSPRWVRRRIEHQPLRLGRNRFGQLLWGQAESTSLVRFDDDRCRTAQLNNVGIAYPIGCRNDHLVTRIECRQKGIEDDRLATRRHHRVRWFIVEPVLALELVGDRLAQFGNSLNRRVAGLVALDRTKRGLLDIVGRGKVRLAGTKANDIAALRDQIARFLRHRNRR